MRMQVISGPYRRMPAHWGSKQPILQKNVHRQNLEDFTLDPWAIAPAGWEGKLVLLFVMQQARQDTIANIYITAGT